MTKKIEGMATLTESEDGKVEIEFAPRCFDSFEGTQEELDKMIADIQHMFESGEMEERATIIDLDDLVEVDPEMAEKVFLALEKESNTRTLQ